MKRSSRSSSRRSRRGGAHHGLFFASCRARGRRRAARRCRGAAAALDHVDRTRRGARLQPLEVCGQGGGSRCGHFRRLGSHQAHHHGEGCYRRRRRYRRHRRRCHRYRRRSRGPSPSHRLARARRRTLTLVSWGNGGVGARGPPAALRAVGLRVTLERVKGAACAMVCSRRDVDASV
jgi:hypothetical protein